MSQNPIQNFLKTYESLANAIQTRFSDLFCPYSSRHPSDQNITPPLPPVPPLLLQHSSKPTSRTEDGTNNVIVQSDGTFLEPPSASKKKSAVPLTKEELGRATWTLLHAIAGQYPDKPTRQQKRDVKELMSIISRLYPCKECSDHFKEVLKANPVQAGSHAEFSDWMCHVHNVVNRSVGKLPFPCQRVDARWGRFDCPDRACDVDGGSII